MEKGTPTPEDILGKAAANPEVVSGAAADAGKTQFPEVHLTEEERRTCDERAIYESGLKLAQKDPLRGDTRDKYTQKEIDEKMKDWDEARAKEAASGAGKESKEEIPFADSKVVDDEDETGEPAAAEEENKEKKIWYPEIKKDIDEATMPVHEWRDKTRTERRPDANIKADRAKVDAAINRLRDREINVKALETERGRKIIWLAKRVVLEGMDATEESKEQANLMLRAMGIDVDRMLEEKEKARAAAAGRTRPDATPPEPPVDPGRPADRPRGEPRSERGEGRENVGDYIKKNEVALNKLLLRDWDPMLAVNPDRDMLAKMVDLSQSIHRENLLHRYSARDGSVYADMFRVAQDLYLKKILGENDYIKIVGTSDSIKSLESSDHTVNMEQRQRFEQILIQLVARTFHSETRRWFEYPEGLEMKNRLERYLINRFNKSENDTDKSETGVVVRFLKQVYLQSDEIRGTQEIKIAKEPNAELLRQIIKIHDLTVMVDAPTFRTVENFGRPELLQSVDEALIAMLSLEKNGTAVVPLVIQEYDTVMRELYNLRRSEINIDDESVRGLVASRLRTVFDTPEEAALFLKMGRDVCCLTGINAQYGYPVVVENKVTSGLAATVKGAFLRGLLNYNKSLITYGTDTRLTGGINLAVVPFLNKLRKVENVASAPITARDIEDLVENKMRGNANYESWFTSLKGPTEAKKAEGEFMNTQPTLENFVTKVIPAYSGYLQFTPDKGKAYFIRRIDSCLPYFLTKGEGKERLKLSIVNLFMKDGNFDGKGIFENADELKKYFTTRGVNVDIDPVKVKERRDDAYEAGRSGDLGGLFRAIFKK